MVPAMALVPKLYSIVKSAVGVHDQRGHIEGCAMASLLKYPVDPETEFSIITKFEGFCRFKIISILRDILLQGWVAGLEWKCGFDRGTFSFVTFLWVSKEK